MTYRLSEIAAICRGRLLGEDLELRSIVTDSRNCNPDFGALFVAMQGVNHDSHRFIEDMERRGVRAFMVEREVSLAKGSGAVVVENSILALQLLAAEYRRTFRSKVVAIAGSNGKTIVKEWLAQALECRLSIFRSPKSYNSQLGVALSLLMARGDEDLIIIEAGISKRGEMERLEQMIAPDVVLFTSIGEAHQENFSTIEEKLQEKLKIARGADTIIYHSHYKAISPVIDEVLPKSIKRVDAAAYRLAESTPSYITDSESGRVDAELVLAACRELGLSPDLSRLEPVAMRLELKEGINNSLIIDDAYNSDINSLAIALDYLHSVAVDREKALIISDIEQSGMEREELYREVASMVHRAGVERLIGVGESLKSSAALFECESSFYSTTDELLLNLKSDDFANRVVLVKGARRSRFERVVNLLELRSHTTILEVNLDDMVHNLNYFRKKVGADVKMVAMVKAGSYGNGNFEVAQMLQHQGVEYLAVAFADEGVLLRDRGITMPIVVLNADEGSFDQMLSHRLEPEIYSLRSMERFSQAVRRAGENSYPIHLKLDTGMHRLGFMECDLEEMLLRLKECDNLKVASIFSHMNCSDMEDRDDYSREQIALFERMTGRVMAELSYPVLRHLAQSAGMVRFPEARFDMCRLGLGLYGFGYTHNEELRPVSTLKSRIVQLRRLKAGERVGYAGAGVLERDSVIATIPVGYADGLDRHLGSGRWSMLVAGKPASIVGRICMDSCMIDVTDIRDVKEGDTAVIFSPEKGNDLESMATLLGTIPYEIMTSISNRVKRIYIKD